MTMDYLIRLAQAHESFRRPELEALASHEGIDVEIVDYQPESPFCVIRFHAKSGCTKADEEVARSFISRAILSRGIHELWGRGATYDELHDDVRMRSSNLWHRYREVSFKFFIDSFCGKRSSTQQREIIDSFRYMGFKGKISMQNPETEFVVLEEWEEARPLGHDVLEVQGLEKEGHVQKRQPKRLFLGRYIGGTRRPLVEKHDLKKRPYISTTSMDAELALLTANLALAAPGKIFLDPFVGTGGFMVAASELGALTFGSDIDGRSFRGKGRGLENGVAANFAKYDLESLFGDCFTSDLTNTPLRYQGTTGGKASRWLDGIISDPPYGVREGLRVLGTRSSRLPPTSTLVQEGQSGGSSTLPPAQHVRLIDGVPAHTLPGYIVPKKPYSFVKMLEDILEFAARTLVDGGRLAFWMPNANEANQELALPRHPCLELKHVCIQAFHKWSRRLLVYERTRGDLVEGPEVILNGSSGTVNIGINANDLNPFRKMYFEGFRT